MLGLQSELNPPQAITHAILPSALTIVVCWMMMGSSAGFILPKGLGVKVTPPDNLRNRSNRGRGHTCLAMAAFLVGVIYMKLDTAESLFDADGDVAPANRFKTHFQGILPNGLIRMMTESEITQTR